jgi:hypothetical protein
MFDPPLTSSSAHEVKMNQWQVDRDPTFQLLDGEAPLSAVHAVYEVSCGVTTGRQITLTYSTSSSI